jgi:hypothetical protein
LLAIALVVAFAVVQKRFPWRVAIAATAVFLPWAVFATFYYGSPIPNSLIVKSTVHSALIVFDHLWVWEFLISDSAYYVLLPIGIASLLLYRKLDDSARFGMVVLAAWFLIRASVLSIVNLGDYFRWYLLLLVPPVIILASVSLSLVSRRVVTARWKRISITILAVGYIAIRNIGDISDRIAHRTPLSWWEADFADLKSAGIFLDRYADPLEVVRGSWGWLAYEVVNPYDDFSGLNSIRMREPASYIVAIDNPMEPKTQALVGKDYVRVAEFNLENDLYPGDRWITVLARRDSKIAASGKMYLKYILPQLDAPAPYSAKYGLANARIEGSDLYAHPPCGASFTVANNRQPILVFFTPSFNPLTPKDKSDGVTFKVLCGDSVVYEKNVLPADSLPTVMQCVAGARNLLQTKLTFMTTPGKANNFDFDWAIWKNVRIVVGNAVIDPARLSDEALIDAWKRFNPVPENDSCWAP